MDKREKDFNQRKREKLLEKAKKKLENFKFQIQNEFNKTKAFASKMMVPILNC